MQAQQKRNHRTRSRQTFARLTDDSRFHISLRVAAPADKEAGGAGRPLSRLIADPGPLPVRTLHVLYPLLAEAFIDWADDAIIRIC